MAMVKKSIKVHYSSFQPYDLCTKICVVSPQIDQKSVSIYCVSVLSLSFTVVQHFVIKTKDWFSYLRSSQMA